MTDGNPQWFYNAAKNPFVKDIPAEWKAYSAEDNQIIEQALKSKAPKAELAEHVIHFQERMQVHKHDFNRQRPIKRDPPPPPK